MSCVLCGLGGALSLLASVFLGFLIVCWMAK